jgi:hypothetical protein
MQRSILSSFLLCGPMERSLLLRAAAVFASSGNFRE